MQKHIFPNDSKNISKNNTEAMIRLGAAGINNLSLSLGDIHDDCHAEYN